MNGYATVGAAIAGRNSAIVGNSTTPILLVSVRHYGETVGTGADRLQPAHATGVTSSVSSVTPEKLNSRTRNAIQTYAAVTAAATNTTLIAFGISGFSHSSICFSPKYAPVASDDNEAIDISSNLGTNSLTTVFQEDWSFPIRRLRRRTTKSGFYPRYGNEIHHQQKTGGGAYSMISPHFDNDITWVDLSAWRNGMSQNEVWEMNLFGPPTNVDSVLPPVSEPLLTSFPQIVSV